MLGYNEETVASIRLDVEGQENFRGDVKILASGSKYSIGVELPDGTVEICDLPLVNSIEAAKDIIDAYWGRSYVWDLQWV